VIPTPAQAGLVLRHLRQAPSDAAVVVPDWPAQPWHQPSMRAAATTISLAGPVWRRARHTEKVPYYEESPWEGAPSRLQPKAPGDVFRQAGYSAGQTRFGRSPEGLSAAFLLAQEHAQSTSYGYGYKWARFLAYCGTPQNLHSPLPSRYPSDSNACGVPVPTEDPVIAALCAGLSRKGGQPPPPFGRFTCRSLRSGCISAAHTIGILLARIMALSGHSFPPVLIRHYLDASIAPSPSAREMFGRMSSSLFFLSGNLSLIITWLSLVTLV
jgi:hypothetical protein